MKKSASSLRLRPAPVLLGTLVGAVGIVMRWATGLFGWICLIPGTAGCGVILCLAGGVR